MTTAAEMRRRIVEEDFVPFVAAAFERGPSLRSAMLLVAQYWADEADDAVHVDVVFSERATPTWPHRCEFDDEGDAVVAAGAVRDTCTTCGNIGWMAFDDNGAGIAAFQSCCREGASQDQSVAEAYLPYAVARRTAAGHVEVEVVGGPVRGWLDSGEAVPTSDDDEDARDPSMVATPPPRVPEREADARTLALFELVCASPADDGPRHVLADHLLEKGDPLGEYVAAALKGGATPRDAAPATAWLGPLGEVAAPENVELARGFPRRVIVHVPDDPETVERVRSARAWGTIEELRFLPQSRVLFGPAMKALRDVGPLHEAGLAELAPLERVLPLERLHVVLRDEATLDRLVALTLPRLVALAVGVAPGGPGLEAQRMRNPFTGAEMLVPVATTSFAHILPETLAPLVLAPFWSRVDELTIVSAAPEVVRAWTHARVAREKTLVFTGASPSLDTVGFRLRVRAAASTATVDVPSLGTDVDVEALGRAITALPPAIAEVRVVPTRWFDPSPADLEALGAAAGRRVVA